MTQNYKYWGFSKYIQVNWETDTESRVAKISVLTFFEALLKFWVTLVSKRKMVLGASG